MTTAKLSVMLIDDNKLDLFLCQKFIESVNITKSITPFHSPVEALNFLKDNDVSTWPDLIVLDIQMPEMDGFEFLKECEQLKNFNKFKSHVIMVSSTLDFGDITRAKANSLVLDLLEKPLKIGNLVEILKYNAIL